MKFQKLLGAALAILAGLTIPLTQDITFACFFVPIGIYLIATKEKYCDVGEEDDEENA